MDEKNKKLFQFPNVLIVEASAGSGKTYCLAKRYLQLLINPYLKPEEIPLETILAITFTNKAASEMKERILEFLKKITLDKFKDPDEKNDILSTFRVKEEIARQKSRIILDMLIRNYNLFQVQTIDSFINTVLCGCAFRINLSAGFKTEKDYVDYLSFSLDKLIDRVNQDKEIFNLFHKFLQQYLYIENKTGWFPKQNIIINLNQLFLKNNKYPGGFIRNNIEAKDILIFKKNILKLMNELKSNLPGDINRALVNKMDNFLETNIDSFDVDDVSEFFKRRNPPVTQGKKIEAKTRTLWNKIRDKLREVCELESASVFNYYIDIFNRILCELKDISAKDDILFLDTLNKEARLLFEEKDFGLPELYLRLATRFKHFLIDEFQDTSRLQWDNLYAMIENALSGDGSLFYVGDKKQAIYRFRGGEVSLIDSARLNFKDILNEDSLTKNFRSQKEIVEFNNMIFSEDNLRRFLAELQRFKKGRIEFAPEDIDEIINVFKASRQSFRKEKIAGYIRLEPLDYNTREERDDILKHKLLDLVEDLRKRFSLKDIAFLTRKNDEVELLSSWFLEKNIPVESEKTLNIKQNPYIKELISFLKFLNSPIDNLSFSSFILGDIFLKATALKEHQIQNFIFEFSHKKRDVMYLYRVFRLRFPEIWNEFFEVFFNNVGFIPLYELVISILNKFNCLRDFYEYQGFFMRLLELIKEQEEKNFSISMFLEFFDSAIDEDLYVNITESDSVKILTIHKSKGLEFGAVILPFLEMSVRVEPNAVIPDNSNFRLIRLKTRYADFSPSLREIYKEEYLKSFIDKLNSIYVAMTRPKDELYIFISPKIQTGFNLASLFFPQKNLELGKKGAYKNVYDKQAPIIEIPPSECADWLNLLKEKLKEEFIDERILRHRQEIQRGEVLHYILSFIGNLYNQDRNLILNQALDKVSAQYPFISDFEEYKLTVNKLLQASSLRQYFEVKVGEVYKELEIIDTFGNTKKIDRLIVKPKEAIVIDYKSSREKTPVYQEQVLEYMKIIQDIYPELGVKGLLIYLDDLSTEEIK
jgi:ATP-dependent exoDNAse (exonuclease V) beta subunit